METQLRYRGREVGPQQIDFLQTLIAAHPQASRRELSRKVCEAWQWNQRNGSPCDMVCRGLMLLLHRAGAIELPPVRRVMRNPFLERSKPEPVAIDNTAVECALKELGAIVIEPVRRTAREPLFNSLIEQYHYLGYEQPVGEHLKYLITANGQPVACAAWSSAARHIGARDRFIGWDQDARKRNIHRMAYNSRFLILPWVKVPHLASHLLGRMAAGISRDWERAYAHPIYMLETFVDRERYRGTCYRAANWQCVGETTGRGKNDLTHRANRSIKDVYVLPVERRFRERLCE